jgi:glutamyl-Q tRNA(Asp) synthetase
MLKPVLRFAPSPNGLLHLGHAYSALFTSVWAEALGGRFLLRIEDTDLTRSKPEFTAAILEDLTWLGLSWEQPVLRQSTRFAVYAAAADRLKARDLLYPCFCSRTELAAHSTDSDPDGAPLYPGTCRHLSPAEVAQRFAERREANWRLKTDEAMALTGLLTYSVAGPTPADRPQIRYARPERWGDVVLQRKGTPTSYHLSVVIDDDAQGVTHVTRGRDMEPSTDIHVLLQMLLGLSAPLYTFHKLILDTAGNKLSKSKGSASLRSLREAGRTAAEIRQELGF